MRNKLIKFLTTPIIPTTLKVSGDNIVYSIAIHLDCPLCKEDEKWKFPKNRRNNFGYHFYLGKHWKPEKGNKDYELHNKLKYHFEIR